MPFLKAPVTSCNYRDPLDNCSYITVPSTPRGYIIALSRHGAAASSPLPGTAHTGERPLAAPWATAHVVPGPASILGQPCGVAGASVGLSRRPKEYGANGLNWSWILQKTENVVGGAQIAPEFSLGNL